MDSSTRQNRLQQLFSDKKDDIVIVENVKLEGLNRTSQSLVQQPLKGLFLVHSYEDLLAEVRHVTYQLGLLGIFKTVDVVLDTSSSGRANAIDIVFHVEERGLIQSKIGTNVGNNEADAYTTLQLTNSLGRAEKISANFSVGTRTHSAFQFDIVKPILLPYEANIKFFAHKNIQDFTALSSFKEIHHGTGFLFNLAIPQRGTHSFGYDLAWRENCSFTSGSSFLVRQQAGHSLKSALKYSLLLDSRDDKILASNGNCLKLSTEMAGLGGVLGGDVHFLKQIAEFQCSRSIKNIIISTAFSSGIFQPIPFVDHPASLSSNINDKFFLGGPTSLRGFTLRGAGPRDGESSLGGDAFWTASFHIFPPFPFQFIRDKIGDSLRPHLFVNAGNISSGHSSNPALRLWNLFSSSQNNPTKLSCGFGLSIRTGIARLEFNYCVPLCFSPTDYCKRGFQFGLGVDFL